MVKVRTHLIAITQVQDTLFLSYFIIDKEKVYYEGDLLLIFKSIISYKSIYNIIIYKINIIIYKILIDNFSDHV